MMIALDATMTYHSACCALALRGRMPVPALNFLPKINLLEILKRKSGCMKLSWI